MEAIKNKKLYELISIVVENGIEKINECIAKSYYMPRHLNYPTVHYSKENGMPRINTTSLGEDRPIDYESFFLPFSPDIDINEIRGYQEYKEYLLQDKRINEYFSPKKYIFPGKDESSITVHRIKNMATNLMSRHLQFKKEGFCKDKFTEDYVLIENCIYQETLPLEVFIPILFTNFDFEEYEINESMSIIKMNNDIQKSRITRQYYPIPIPSAVLEGATHTLVLKGLELKNNSYWDINSVLSKPESYPQAKINLFFNSMRIATDVNTGYAQLIAKPINWAESYESDLVPLHGTTIKSYPSNFDNYYWLSSALPTLTLKDVQKIKDVFNTFVKTEDKKLLLANRRLHQCYMRENEEDSILDATIAMEALLSDGERGELTHKLSLRMAVLLKLSPDIQMETIEVFNAVKHIYGYRSSVVHGSSKVSSKREIKIPSGEPIPTIELAITLLRSAIQVLLNHPKYLDPKKIDEDLLLKDI
ncbi:hypothetical protein ACQKGI_19875 [Peribacillus muralis]|uniref:hypothetical protein n=1 Tax=Peribacillus muralis TaxID=264697 RepID=UPI00380A40C7